MTIAEYMAMALSHPEHGYYRRADAIGAAGDFITAPEISQMFGELVGLWLVDAWDRILGAPSRLNLLELGPGRGTLLADALRAASLRPAFLDAVRIHLVETSPILIERQRAALAIQLAAGRSIHWHETLAGVPGGDFLVIANEFFDALPIRQFVRRDAGWVERLVGLDAESGNLALTLADHPLAEDPLLAALSSHDYAPVIPGTIAEIGEAGRALAGLLGERLSRAAGVALIIDYGPSRSSPGDSLQAVRGHRFADPLADPGRTDLTAHVDFASLARAARDAGAISWGPVPQGVFLRRLGIESRARRLAEGGGDGGASVLRALARLIDPSEMGTLFKALALASPGLPAPAGFLLEDRPKTGDAIR